MNRLIKILYILIVSFLYSQYAPFFDGEIAFKYLEKQCSFGERYPGSQNHLNLNRLDCKWLILKNYIIRNGFRKLFFGNSSPEYRAQYSAAVPFRLDLFLKRQGHLKTI